MEFCKVCGRRNLERIFPELPEERGKWFRCGACGSDSNEATYREIMPYYRQSVEYAENNTGRLSKVDELVEDMQSNLAWFDDHCQGIPARTFLDVGCLEGAALVGMRNRGWHGVFGFDVGAGAGAGAGEDAVIRTNPFFHRWIFDEPFGAIMLREVIEHVDGWRQLLVELFYSLHPGGLLQVQTPRVLMEPHWIPYQGEHLVLFSPATLETKLKEHGFAVLDTRIWEIGFAVMCRRPR